MPIYGTRKSICGHFWQKMMRLHSFPSAQRRELVIHKPVRQVNIMAIILFIYSSVLALGVWQENQNQNQPNQNQNEDRKQRQGC